MKRLFATLLVLLMFVPCLVSAGDTTLTFTKIETSSSPGYNFDTEYQLMTLSGTLSGQDTIQSNAIELPRYGYNTVYFRAYTSDSVAIDIKFRLAPFDSTSMWTVAKERSAASITDTLGNSYALRFPATPYTKLYLYGGAANKAGGTAFKLYVFTWGY